MKNTKSQTKYDPCNLTQAQSQVEWIFRKFDINKIKDGLTDLGHDIDVFETKSDFRGYVECLADGTCGDDAKSDFQQLRTDLITEDDDTLKNLRHPAGAETRGDVIDKLAKAYSGKGDHGGLFILQEALKQATDKRDMQQRLDEDKEMHAEVRAKLQIMDEAKRQRAIQKEVADLEENWDRFEEWDAEQRHEELGKLEQGENPSTSNYRELHKA